LRKTSSDKVIFEKDCIIPNNVFNAALASVDD
jgi:hypothetical protein